MHERDKPPRGRKRSEQATDAILTAAYDLTVECGYDALTIEGIATRAGAGKQTVYRWWSTKADILLDALVRKADLRVSVDDKGSFRADVETFLRDSAAVLAHTGTTEILRSLMGEAQRDNNFRRRFQDGFLQRRRAALATVLDRADRRGDHPSHLSSSTVIDVVFGLIWYRVLATDQPFGEEDVAGVVRLVTAHGGIDTPNTQQ